MKRVICINAENSGNKLKKGKEYVVLKERTLNNASPVYLIPYNLYDDEWFSSSRFKVVGEPEEKEDVVNNPNHYKGNKGIETIDFIENVLTREEFIGYLRGNVIKYQSRANLKGRKEEDLKKAKWYSNKLVEVLKD